MSPEGKANADVCISALRAMMTVTERAKLGDTEPVTYLGKEVDGYALVFKADDKLALLGQGMAPAMLMHLLATFIRAQRKEMPVDQFREMILPLLIELTEEVIVFVKDSLNDSESDRP